MNKPTPIFLIKKFLRTGHRFLFGGLFAFAALTHSAFAASTGTINVGVFACSSAVPDVSTGTLASPTFTPGSVSLSWVAPQGNAGGTPINNLTVAAYQVKVATFSVDSLAGDTTAWWTHPSGTTYILQPPGFVPVAPGAMQSNTFASLTPGTTVYFGLKSVSPCGPISSIDLNSATPGSQAFALVPGVIGVPKKPQGLLGTYDSSLQNFTFSWHAVTQNTLNTPVTVTQYVVERSTAIGGTSVVVTTVTVPGSLEYTELTSGQTYFYRVKAYSGSVVSELSDYIDSSSAMNRWVIYGGDLLTRAVYPRAAAQELAGSNSYVDDIALDWVARPSEETGLVVQSYELRATRNSTGDTIDRFALSNQSTVQISYVPALLSARLQTNQSVALFWYNGRDYIQVGNASAATGNAISQTVRNSGLYQLRIIEQSNSFHLISGSPYPRIMMPNMGQNNRVFWYFDNPRNSTVIGRIYDIRGALVRQLAVDSSSPSANAIVWDGRTDHGGVAPTGVYIYKLQAGQEVITGTVVVAR